MKQAVLTIPVQKNDDISSGEYIAVAGIREQGFEKLSWKILADVKYNRKRTKDYPEGIMYPAINPMLKAKKGANVVISGYIIPIDEKSFAVSKNVMSACFFCGMAGPETIMGIKFKGKTPRLKTDQYLTLSGTFNFNETNPDDWIYHIENAVITAGK